MVISRWFVMGRGLFEDEHGPVVEGGDGDFHRAPLLGEIQRKRHAGMPVGGGCPYFRHHPVGVDVERDALMALRRWHVGVEVAPAHGVHIAEVEQMVDGGSRIRSAPVNHDFARRRPSMGVPYGETVAR